MGPDAIIAISVAAVAGGFGIINLILSAWWSRAAQERAAKLENTIEEERQERRQQFETEKGEQQQRYDTQLLRVEDELAQRREAETREHVAMKLMRSYQDPLLRTAYDLQGKLFNILTLHLLDEFYLNGSEVEKEYAVENTLYAVAEHFGWVEIVRREVQLGQTIRTPR